MALLSRVHFQFPALARLVKWTVLCHLGLLIYASARFYAAGDAYFQRDAFKAVFSRQWVIIVWAYSHAIWLFLSVFVIQPVGLWSGFFSQYGRRRTLLIMMLIGISVGLFQVGCIALSGWFLSHMFEWDHVWWIDFITHTALNGFVFMALALCGIPSVIIVGVYVTALMGVWLDLEHALIHRLTWAYSLSDLAMSQMSVMSMTMWGAVLVVIGIVVFYRRDLLK